MRERMTSRVCCEERYRAGSVKAVGSVDYSATEAGDGWAAAGVAGAGRAYGAGGGRSGEGEAGRGLAGSEGLGQAGAGVFHEEGAYGCGEGGAEGRQGSDYRDRDQAEEELSSGSVLFAHIEQYARKDCPLSEAPGHWPQVGRCRELHRCPSGEGRYASTGDSAPARARWCLGESEAPPARSGVSPGLGREELRAGCAGQIHTWCAGGDVGAHHG